MRLFVREASDYKGKVEHLSVGEKLCFLQIMFSCDHMDQKALDLAKML